MKKHPKHPKNREIEQFGTLLATLYESGYLSRKRMVVYSFVRGFASGIGGFIGATVGISLLLWVASILMDIPLLGHLIEAVQNVASDSGA